MGGRGAVGGGGVGALQHLTMGVFLIIRVVLTHQEKLTTKYFGRVLKSVNVRFTSFTVLLVKVFVKLFLYDRFVDGYEVTTPYEKISIDMITFI